MPTSDNENKYVAKQWIDEVEPKRVLDVGCGEGTYSILARTDNQEWIGIEAFYPYVNQYDLNNKYNKVIISDVRYLDYNKLGQFDLSIAGDMLEHMTKGEAKEVISGLLSISSYVLLCFPVLHLNQHIDDNPFEEHIDHWDNEEMTTYLQTINATVVHAVAGEVLAYHLVKGNL